jgi:hypothetical protein
MASGWVRTAANLPALCSATGDQQVCASFN